MRNPKVSVSIALLVAVIFSTPLGAQERPSVAQWIDENNVHRIAGYATLGLSTTTAALGLIGLEVHPAFGYATAGFSVSTVVLGAIAYQDRKSYAWPHMLLNSLAATGFLLNGFIFEDGSTAHIATGVASLASMYGAYIYIILKTR